MAVVTQIALVQPIDVRVAEEDRMERRTARAPSGSRAPRGRRCAASRPNSRARRHRSASTQRAGIADPRRGSPPPPCCSCGARGGSPVTRVAMPSRPPRSWSSPPSPPPAATSSATLTPSSLPWKASLKISGKSSLQPSSSAKSQYGRAMRPSPPSAVGSLQRLLKCDAVATMPRGEGLLHVGTTAPPPCGSRVDVTTDDDGHHGTQRAGSIPTSQAVRDSIMRRTASTNPAAPTEAASKLATHRHVGSAPRRRGCGCGCGRGRARARAAWASTRRVKEIVEASPPGTSLSVRSYRSPPLVWRKLARP